MSVLASWVGIPSSMSWSLWWVAGWLWYINTSLASYTGIGVSRMVEMSTNTGNLWRKTYTGLGLVFPDLVIQFSVVQRQPNVGSEEVHQVSVLLWEDLLPALLLPLLSLLLVDKLENCQDCSPDSEGGAVQGPGPPTGLNISTILTRSELSSNFNWKLYNTPHDHTNHTQHRPHLGMWRQCGNAH